MVSPGASKNTEQTQKTTEQKAEFIRAEKKTLNKKCTAVKLGTPMSNVIIDIERELSGVSGTHKNVPITQRTETELLKWKGQKETDQAMYSTLQKYWKDAGLQDTDWKPSETPWSAVFISTLLKGHGFPYSVAHRLYTRAIIDSPSSWGAYSIPKTKKLQLHVGDVLIKPRTGSYQATHGDVVYKIADGMAYLAGGNVGDTARSVGTLPIDQDGFVEGKVSNYVVILKKKGGSYLPLILGFAGLIGFFMVKK